MKRQERAQAVVSILAATYPDAHCELVFHSPFELLIATILSAQCTDVRVNATTPALFQQCPDVEAFVQIPQQKLEKLIHSTGFFRSKAKNIKGAAEAILRYHGGDVPSTLEALTKLPGVGRKTANVVLGNAFGKNEGIVVDTHVARLSQRLRLTSHSDPVKIEKNLVRLVPREQWTLFSHWLIWHGRRRCHARNPDCAACELASLCPSAGKVSKSRQPLER